MRVLYLQASWVPPSQNLSADRFVLLSEKLEGEVLQPLWFERPEQVEEEFGPGTYENYQRGRFRYHWFLSFRHKGWRRRVSSIWFYIQKGLEVHRERPYDCIVVYSHMMPALAAAVLKLLTGAKLVVEIMTSPELAYLYEHPKQTFSDRLLRLFSDFSLYVSVLMSDRVHLLYPSQLSHYPMLRRIPVSVFHDFVPVSLIERVREEERERVIFFVGGPWYLKGVDLLVEAFRRISPEFPDVTLRLQGYNPDPESVHALAAGHPRIDVQKAVANLETLRRISRAMILVNPSRCDGLARVLIEAMNAGVPVIASTAGGNPSCVEAGVTGLVFPSENVDELTRVLREMLSNPELRHTLGSNGFQLGRARFSETVYVNEFARMVEDTVGGARRQAAQNDGSPA